MEWFVAIVLLYLCTGMLVILAELRKRREIDNGTSVAEMFFAGGHPIALLLFFTFWPLIATIDSFDRACRRRAKDETAANAADLERRVAERECFERSYIGAEAKACTALRPHGQIELAESCRRLPAKSANGLIQPRTTVRIESFDAHGNALVRPE